MYLHTCASRELNPAYAASAFSSQQCIVLRNAIDAETARSAFKAFGKLMEDTGLLRQHPFDPSTRLGYTPPGIETTQRDPGNRDWNRAMFDFSPALSLGEPSVAALYGEAVGACELVLACLDEAYGTCLLRAPQGGHTLRTAQYLLNGTSSEEVLFPRHRDFSLLTAFIGSGSEGLEVEADGEWQAAELEYGDVLIGAGTPLGQFHLRLKPLWHRVVGGTDHRLSSFLFFELREDVVLPKTKERYGDMLARVLKSVRAA